MYTLSIFPSLLSWNQLAPFLIRITVGITLAYFGYQKTRNKGQSSGSNSFTYGIVEIVIAAFLIVGLYTQLAALVNALILIIKLAAKAKGKALLTDGINYYILLLVMCLSLLVTGAGMFSLDLPL